MKLVSDHLEAQIPNYDSEAEKAVNWIFGKIAKISDQQDKISDQQDKISDQVQLLYLTIEWYAILISYIQFGIYNLDFFYSNEIYNALQCNFENFVRSKIVPIYVMYGAL